MTAQGTVHVCDWLGDWDQSPAATGLLFVLKLKHTLLFTCLDVETGNADVQIQLFYIIVTKVNTVMLTTVSVFST